MLSLCRRKSLGTGNDAECKRRAEIAWLQGIFEFHTVYIACLVETGETTASSAYWWNANSLARWKINLLSSLKLAVQFKEVLAVRMFALGFVMKPEHRMLMSPVGVFSQRFAFCIHMCVYGVSTASSVERISADTGSRGQWRSWMLISFTFASLR